MGDTFSDIALSGPLALAVGVALLAGLVSFLSPCVLPLVPGYLSYVTGLVGADLDEGRRRGRVLAGTLLFVAGFGVVFVSMTVASTSLAMTLARSENRRVIEIVGGSLIILLGIAFLGLVPALQREWRIHTLPSAGLVGAPVFGAVFAFSWVPCIGPTLGAVLTLSSVGGSLPRAVILGIAYTLGLGLPFVVFGIGFRRVLGLVRVIRRNSVWVMRVGGGLLVLVGLALVTGGWGEFVGWLRSATGEGWVPF